MPFTRASDGRLVFYGAGDPGLDRTRVVSFPAGARYIDGGVRGFGHTWVEEHPGGVKAGDSWWALVSNPPLPDNRMNTWDESAEEGPDEGRPYQSTQYSYPELDPMDPRTGVYHKEWPPTRAEPDPSDLLPDATFITVRRMREAAPNPLEGLGQATSGWVPWAIGGFALAGLAYCLFAMRR